MSNLCFALRYVGTVPFKFIAIMNAAQMLIWCRDV